VDYLLKKEFDVHRAKNQKHPLCEHYGVDAVPFAHPALETWRENFKGITFLHKPTNLIISGAVDDVWVNPEGELIVVDYKATAKDSEVNLDAAWQDGYKHQMEIYQWLFRQNGFKVSPTGYFVYCNGKRDREAFDAKLEFDIKLIPYTGSDAWVEGAITKTWECLQGPLPKATPGCDYCTYRAAAQPLESGVLSAPVKVSRKTTVRAKTIVKAKAKAGSVLF
jgi:RecB family exonuclease